MSYRWSNAIADIRGIPGSANLPSDSGRLVLDVLDLAREPRSNPTNQRRRFVGSFVYQLPWGRTWWPGRT